METVDPLRFVFAFLFVIGLIGLCALALKRFSRTQSGKILLSRGMVSGQGEGRLQVLEVRYIDVRRRLALVRCDDREHLLLLADNREMVVESFPAKQEKVIPLGKMPEAMKGKE